MTAQAQVEPRPAGAASPGPTAWLLLYWGRGLGAGPLYQYTRVSDQSLRGARSWGYAEASLRGSKCQDQTMWQMLWPMGKATAPCT